MEKKMKTRRETYYKVQTWEERSFAWKDVQRSYDSKEDAIKSFPKDRKCRVMQITALDRHPVT